jgi:hypothetical protein
VGEYDRVTPPAGAVALAAALPEGRFVLIPNAGHIPMLEAPDAVAGELARFARELAPPAPPRRRKTTGGTRNTRKKKKKEEGAA